MSHSHQHYIRELLRDFKELGVRVVVFLDGFHVEGRVRHVGNEFVVLTTNVEVESNSSGVPIENPNRIWIKISKIRAVSDDHGA
ncbi:hypothetical protein [Alicyclobacillus dauci]|uniref:LSM domain-containing protein n=1 Tax=Alicyclobacillus dauci TaxID=1475485 RepID=A0ABY6Z9G9_9BACL|nr:hypothetical protein [Alicyclobacillus dauci]WAH39459.1 hypothetical protein NZD86_23480 [Alicyclobacillus dauci]